MDGRLRCDNVSSRLLGDSASPITSTQQPIEKLTIQLRTKQLLSSTLTREETVGVQARVPQITLPTSQMTDVEEKSGSLPVKMEEPTLHACSQCNRVFKKFYQLSRHAYQYHVKPTCTACNNSFGRMKELKEHAVSSHELKMNKLCSLCKKAYSTRQDLENHLKEDHLKEQPFICMKCPRVFSDEERLKTHMMIHSRRRGPVRCTQCNETFSSPFQLNKHKYAVHAGNKSLICPGCGVDFVADEEVRKRICELHLKAAPKVKVEEGEEKSFFCMYCEKPFETPRLRNQHIRAEHADKRPFKCSICPFIFETEEDVERHVLVRHTRRTFRPRTGRRMKEDFQGDSDQDGQLQKKATTNGLSDIPETQNGQED